MNPIPTLKGSHLRTYNTIFQHPISHNLEWRNVLSMFRHIGEVEEESNGNLKITRNGQTLVLHRANTKDVADSDAVMKLRHFLEKSESLPPEPESKDAHWILWIDHHEARIFRSDIKGVHAQRLLPEEYFRHTRDSGNVSRGKEKPEAGSFFQPIAEALKPAAQILVFGSGTGSSNEMDQFNAWMKAHHPEIAKRIVGSLVTAEHNLSDEQLLAKAREYYASAQPPENSDGKNTEPTRTLAKEQHAH